MSFLRRNVRSRRPLKRSAVAVAGACLALVLTAAPAAAPIAYVGAYGASGWGSWTWVDHNTVGSIKLNVKDTVCNATQARVDIDIYEERTAPIHYYRENKSGCRGPSQTWSLGTISSEYDLINIRICVSGGGKVVCSSYMDNPRS